MENKRYYGILVIKKDVYVTAKNRTEARKKINNKLQTQKGNRFVKIEFLEDCFC